MYWRILPSVFIISKALSTFQWLSFISTAFADSTHELGLGDLGNSGILGIAFPAASSISPSVGRTLLENIFASLDDDHRYFAFNLGRNNADSTFSFGRLDPAFANSTEALTLSPVFIGPKSIPDYWKLPMRAITVNGTAIFSSFSPSRIPGSLTPVAVLDTGTTFILGPSADVDAFWNAAGGSRKTESGQWEVQCTRAVSVGFVLGDGQNEYAVDPLDISWRPAATSEAGWCVGGIQINNNVNSGDWILGDTFLRNVYATHHGATSNTPPRIGLLGLTDTSTAFARFRLERGYDFSSPMTARVVTPAGAHSMHFVPALACGVVLLGSSLLGGLMSWFVQSRSGNVRKYNGAV